MSRLRLKKLRDRAERLKKDVELGLPEDSPALKRLKKTRNTLGRQYIRQLKGFRNLPRKSAKHVKMGIKQLETYTQGLSMFEGKKEVESNIKTIKEIAKWALEWARSNQLKDANEKDRLIRLKQKRISLGIKKELSLKPSKQGGHVYERKLKELLKKILKTTNEIELNKIQERFQMLKKSFWY